MDKKIGLVIAVIGLAILLFNLFQTVSTQSAKTIFLMPLGLLLAIGGAMFYMFKSRKEKT